ncbi:MAG TPA: hypothetical protein VJO99_16045 [Burkholderiaceae bacterium]|nr:hypothetical protein [Burkholderiaceae bacterium]
MRFLGEIPRHNAKLSRYHCVVIEKLFAGVVLAVCIVLMLRLLIGARRRGRFDAAVRRSWLGSRRFLDTLWHWRSRRREAQRAADAAIRRARGHEAADGEWEGNVYKPKSFRKPRKLH